MQQVVYVDLLLLVNICVDFLLLCITASLCGTAASKGRIMLLAFVMSLFSLAIFMPPVPGYVSLVLRLFAALPAGFLANRFGYKEFLKIYIIFLVLSFLLAGIVTAISIFITPQGLLWQNGVLYIDIGPLALIGFSAAAYLIVDFSSRLMQRRIPREELYTLSICCNGKETSAAAFLDSGNQAFDIYTGKPLIFCSIGVIQQLFSEEIRFGEKDGFSAMLSKYPQFGWRMVPCITVHGRQLIPVFTAERIVIKSITGNLSTVCKAPVAVCHEKICGGKYDALIGKSWLTEAKAYDEKER